MENVYIMNHPLISHKLAILRDKDTNGKVFRELVSEIAMLICYEATRDLPLTAALIKHNLKIPQFSSVKTENK
ncbi:MAG: hypothetical protein LUG52_06925, partial [Clostridia bacterium]|nr:hypothetical protein [Clostridia bacterium]